MVDQMDAGRGVPSPDLARRTPVGAGAQHARVFGEPGRLARRRAEELEAEAHEKQADALRCWASAAGEEATANELARLPVEFQVFHDLRRARGQGNIDHLVIGPPGAYVIESTSRSGDLKADNGAGLRRHVDGLVAQGRDIGADLDGVPAQLILCLVSGTLAGPTVELGPVVALPLAGLVDHLRSRPTVLDERDVRSISHLVHQRFLGFSVGSGDGSAHPSPRPTPDAVADDAPADDQPGPTRFGRTERLVVRITLALLVIAFAVVGVRCGIETVQGLAARPDQSPRITPRVSCPTPGAGYAVTVAFPEVEHPEIAAFDVRALVHVASWVDLGTWRSAVDVPDQPVPALTGLGPNTRVEVRSRTVFSDGTTLPERLTRTTTPQNPC